LRVKAAVSNRKYSSTPGSAAAHLKHESTELGWKGEEGEQSTNDEGEGRKYQNIRSFFI